MAPFVQKKIEVFLLTSHYFRFSWVQARPGQISAPVSSLAWLTNEQSPALVTWHTRVLAPGPIKRQIISRFPVCFPPSLLESLCSGFSGSDDISPAIAAMSPLTPPPFQVWTGRNQIKVSCSPPSFLQTSVSAGLWEMGTWQNCSGKGKKLRHSSSISSEGIVVWSPEETEYYVCLPGERFITFARLDIALGPGPALLTAIFLLPDSKIINVQK